MRIKTVLCVVVLAAFFGTATPAHTCELADKPCLDRDYLARGGDLREIAEDDAATQRFRQAIHCSPWDATHPGRCDGVQDGPDVEQTKRRAEQNFTADLRAAHARACQLGYAPPGYATKKLD